MGLQHHLQYAMVSILGDALVVLTLRNAEMQSSQVQVKSSAQREYASESAITSVFEQLATGAQ